MGLVLLLAILLVLLFSVINGAIIIGTAMVLRLPHMAKRKVALIAGVGSMTLTAVSFYALLIRPMEPYFDTTLEPQFGTQPFFDSMLIAGLAWAHMILGAAATVYCLYRTHVWSQLPLLMRIMMTVFLFAHVLAILLAILVLIQ